LHKDFQQCIDDRYTQERLLLTRASRVYIGQIIQKLIKKTSVTPGDIRIWKLLRYLIQPFVMNVSQ
jgi:hypothetical protein